jgi:PAS domain S-box-containing protein
VVPSQEFCRKFLSRVASPTGFDVLFDYVPDVYFFVKDRAGRFMRVNQAFSKLARATHAEDVIGGRDPDFFPASLAENYMKDDQQVLVSSEAMIDKAELMRHPDGSTDWFCTTKLPLFDRAGRAIGICGITRDVKRMNTTHARFLSWAPVLETLLDEYGSPLEIPMLARKMALSVSQFNRQFKRRFHTTPRAYLTEVRLKAACHFLVTTELSMSEIALRTGFYDQSHFTNQFVKHQGMTPSKYRAAHGQAAEEANLEVGNLRRPSKELTVVSKDGLS